MKPSAKVGLGLRKSFYSEALNHSSPVPWFEIITENFLGYGGRNRELLAKAHSQYPLAYHGVSLSVGSPNEINWSYLSQLKQLLAEFPPLWVSDHLCWTSWMGQNSHDLLPLPLTRHSLDHVSNRVLEIQDYLGVRLYLENPSAYVKFNCDHIPEADFLAELSHRSGCGVLLDLNNLYVNQQNLGSSYETGSYLRTLAGIPVVQFHLAGHTIESQVRIDTHDQPLYPELDHLLRDALQIWPEAKPMIEWDGNIPDFSYLLEELDRLQAIVDMTQTTVTQHLAPTIADKVTPTHQVMQKFWIDLQDGSSNVTDLAADCPTPPLVGKRVYQSAYYLRLIEVLRSQFPVFYAATEEYFEHLVRFYIKNNPSRQTSIDLIGHDFGAFVSSLDLEGLYSEEAPACLLGDLARFEYALTQSFLAPDESDVVLPSNLPVCLKRSTFILHVKYQVHALWEAQKNQGTLILPLEEPTYYAVSRRNNAVAFRILSDHVASQMSQFEIPRHLTEIDVPAEMEAAQELAQAIAENLDLLTMISPLESYSQLPMSLASEPNRRKTLQIPDLSC